MNDGLKADAQWFIMTSLDPKDSEEQIKLENLRRTESGTDSFQYFVPYQFLKRRMANDGTKNEDPLNETAVEAPVFYNPKNRTDVAANNEIRSALRRYIFVKAPEEELVDFLHGEWNRLTFNRLQFYLDKEHRRVTVSQRMMDQFIEACADYRLQFELWPSVEDISKNEQVILNTTAFRGEKAHVLEVVHTKGGIKLTIGIDLFSGTMLLRLPNVSERDIIREQKETGRIDESRLIESTQNHLLAILSRRVNRKQTDDSIPRDAATLDTIYNYRYHRIGGDAARRHFLALMLICAHLRRDGVGRSELTAAAARELALINGKSESKAATDVRTYLQIALYIATGNPEYRTAAKDYVRLYEPKSKALRQFVKLIKKRQTI